MNPGRDDDVERLQSEVSALRAENERMASLLGLRGSQTAGPFVSAETVLFPGVGDVQSLPPKPVDQSSSRQEKVAFFRSIFAGRDDVYARRWENEHSGKSGWSPVIKGGWVNAKKPDRQYLALTDEVITSHLAGDFHAGLYPLHLGDTTRLLACDFDKGSWILDAIAYMDAAKQIGISTILERSRSGNGGHVWTFFAGTVASSSARRIGAHLLREAMAARAEIDLASYDRLFPTQDFMPKGSFGNLIALPLQGACRKKGTTVFLDRASLEPANDQWAYLSSIERLSPEAVESLVASLDPIAAGPEDAIYVRPRIRLPDPKPPEQIAARLVAMIEIDRIGMPPALLASLKHLASLHNPIYYDKEKKRFSTWNTPRFVRCYGESVDRLLLPRGVIEKAKKIIDEAGSSLVVVEDFDEVATVNFELAAVLSGVQQEALAALIAHDLGVFVAPPGSGKTVVACAVIASRKAATLVIVDRKHLAEQWRERLQTHLGLQSRQIGQLGGGRNRQSRIVDIAMAQSLARRDDLEDLTSGYGLVVVDECHHIPSITFERCVKSIPVKRWLGLTATPYRRDGLHGLIPIYCGPVRHRITERATSRELVSSDLIIHDTDHFAGCEPGLPIQEVFRRIAADETRTEQVCMDVADAVGRGRNCLVLTDRIAHIEAIKALLADQGIESIVLRGGLAKAQRIAAVQALDQAGSGDGVVVVATGSFIGEGFDAPALDTLFLAFPLAFKGRLEQYAGRIMRSTHEKVRMEIHDYVDREVPVLAAMHSKRLAVLSSLGFVKNAPNLS